MATHSSPLAWQIPWMEEPGGLSSLCDPTDGSPPGSPVAGILQARTLEWGAITFSDCIVQKF